MEDNAQNKLDKLAGKYESFSNSKLGSVILDFVTFKKNLMPYTLQIAYGILVLVTWIVAVIAIFKQGPLAAFFSDTLKDKDGKMVDTYNYLAAIGVALVLVVLAPFVFHYILELVKKVVWPLLVHVYEKVLLPIWNTLIVRFLANVFPQVLPFLYERAMRVVDILVDRLGAFLDAVIDLFGAAFVTLVTVVKGIVWFPKVICQRLNKWVNKPEDGAAK